MNPASKEEDMKRAMPLYLLSQSCNREARVSLEARERDETAKGKTNQSASELKEDVGPRVRTRCDCDGKMETSTVTLAIGEVKAKPFKPCI